MGAHRRETTQEEREKIWSLSQQGYAAPAIHKKVPVVSERQIRRIIVQA